MKRSGGSAIRLDRLDVKILATLQTAGRISNLELADTLGLSATPSMQRVRRMEAAGYISGYAAQLEFDRICSNIAMFSRITPRHLHDAASLPSSPRPPTHPPPPTSF